MTSVFLIMLGVHFVCSVAAGLRSRDRTPNRRDYVLLVSQTPILGLGAVLAWRAGAFNRELLSPMYIGLGLLGGHAIFGLSVLATHRSWRAAGEMLGQFGPLWRYVADNPMVLFRVATASVAEEIIYRGAAQPAFIRLTNSVAGGILIGAVVFSLVHSHFFRNTAAVSVEFAAFSIALGVLYHVTASLTLVSVIHGMRNIEIHFLEDTIRRENGETPQPAADPFGHPAPGSLLA